MAAVVVVPALIGGTYWYLFDQSFQNVDSAYWLATHNQYRFWNYEFRCMEQSGLPMADSAPKSSTPLTTEDAAMTASARTARSADFQRFRSTGIRDTSGRTFEGAKFVVAHPRFNTCVEQAKAADDQKLQGFLEKLMNIIIAMIGLVVTYLGVRAATRANEVNRAWVVVDGLDLSEDDTGRMTARFRLHNYGKSPALAVDVGYEWNKQKFVQQVKSVTRVASALMPESGEPRSVLLPDDLCLALRTGSAIHVTLAVFYSLTVKNEWKSSTLFYLVKRRVSPEGAPVFEIGSNTLSKIG